MNGIERIAAERKRQIEQEGWTAEHDDNENASGELTRAAASYTDFTADLIEHGEVFVYWDVPVDWPFHDNWWKPSDDPIRNLEKAGALIAAEIDRILRARGEQ